MRVELAISRHEPSVPVVYVELSEDEERLVLASLDPLAAMATAEKDALAALLAEIETGDAALARMLAELGDHHGIRRPILGDPTRCRRSRTRRTSTSSPATGGSSASIDSCAAMPLTPRRWPDAVEAWAERLRLAEELAVMADHLAELDGVPPAAPWDPHAVSTRAAVLVADLVEPARVTTLDKLDEGRQALTIATGWLRSKMQPLSAANDPGGPAAAATL